MKIRQEIFFFFFCVGGGLQEEVCDLGAPLLYNYCVLGPMFSFSYL